MGEYIPPRNLKGVSKEELDYDIANLSNEEWKNKYSAHWSEGIDDSIPLIIRKKDNKKMTNTIKDIKSKYAEYLKYINSNTVVLPYERMMRSILDIDPTEMHIATDKDQMNKILDTVVKDSKIKEEVNSEFQDGLIFYLHRG